MQSPTFRTLPAPQPGALQGACTKCSGASVLLWPVAFKSGKLTKVALEDERSAFQKQEPLSSPRFYSIEDVRAFLRPG